MACISMLCLFDMICIMRTCRHLIWCSVAAICTIFQIQCLYDEYVYKLFLEILLVNDRLQHPRIQVSRISEQPSHRSPGSAYQNNLQICCQLHSLPVNRSQENLILASVHFAAYLKDRRIRDPLHTHCTPIAVYCDRIDKGLRLPESFFCTRQLL
jgi:hypothetical protein